MITWAAERYYALLTIEGTSASLAAKLVALGTGLVSAAVAIAIFHYVWSGRASQENFVDTAVAVLHQCIQPLIGAFCAPGHRGYQRACELISGQASTGPFGSPVFACAGKTEPPSRLILSQTSAGK